MTLLVIIFSLVLFSLITNFFNKKQEKIFVIVSILLIVIFYFFLATDLNLFKGNVFFPDKAIVSTGTCSNYYNLLVDSLRNYKLNIFEHVSNKDYNINNFLLDTSLYNNKIYLYFGITPVLLFYLPFNLITNLYLTDKLLIFILSFFSFIFSLILVNKATENHKNIPSNIIILTIFLIGLCNLLPFITMKGLIYQVTIITANVLLLVSFYLFYYYINTSNTNKKYILLFFISLLLCFAVGSRPNYILTIPVFFFFIVYLKYKEKSTKDIFKTILIFLIPCFIYGTFLALYNYLRFDSIFEFGWKYQLNSNNQAEFAITFKDFLMGLKNNFLLLPNMNESTIFSLAKTSGHRIGHEYITGVFWTCPIIFIFFFIPHFLKETYKKSINNFIFILTLLTITIINIFIASFFGMIIRYIFEYLSLMVILSVIMFLYYIGKIEDKLTKNLANFLFILIFIFSIFINISLLFCKENFWEYTSLKDTNYTKVVNFLF